MSEVVKGILRAVSSGLQIPTIIILILLILLTIFMLGSFFAELLTERRSLKMNIPKLVDQLQGKSTAQMKEVIASSSLLTRQKAAAQELISRVTYPEDTREALARQLIADEEARYAKIVKITDLTARVAPMFGLMGTLIPLGPGLIALGEGDAATLSSSLLIAFDTTVAGLISGALSYIVSGFRKSWYEEYMIGLETIMETILDVQNEERGKALQQRKTADAAKTGNTASRDTVTMPQQQAPKTGQTRAAAPQQAARPAAQAQPRPAAAPSMPGSPADVLNQTPQAKAARAAAGAAQTSAAAAQAQPRPAAPSVTAKPTFAQANSPTIAGYDAEVLQAEVRAAEAAAVREKEQIQSLDELLENFAPKDGGQ